MLSDATVSFDATDLQVGTARIDNARFGLSYWRDDLTIAALESPIYGGRLDGSVGF